MVKLSESKLWVADIGRKTDLVSYSSKWRSLRTIRETSNFNLEEKLLAHPR